MSENTTDVDGGSQSASAAASRRFFRLLAACLLLPPILCVPAIWMLRRDARGHDEANVILRAGLDSIASQIADVSDYYRVRSTLLARMQVSTELQAASLPAMEALHVFVHLPASVKLLALEIQNRRISFGAQCATDADELVMLDTLWRSGYRDLRITARASPPSNAVDLVAISASLAPREQR